MSWLVGGAEGPGDLRAEHRSDGLCPLVGVDCISVSYTDKVIIGFSHLMSLDKGDGPKGTRLIHDPSGCLLCACKVK